MPRVKTAAPMSGAQSLLIVYLEIASLAPDERNARKHTREQIERLAVGIREFGFVNPIIVDEVGRIIAGHARHAAAKLLEMAVVPCIRLVNLSSVQKKALALADNKLHDMSTFDPDQLLVTLKEIEALDFKIELTGFETPEFDALDEAVAQIGSTADSADTLPASDLPVVTQLGDLWLLGKHRLLCGTALEEGSFERLLGQDRAHIVISDQPFNVPINGHVSGLGKVKHREFAFASGEMTPAEFVAFLRTSMTLMARYSVDGSLHYQFMDWRHIAEMMEAGSSAYSELKNLVVWNKHSAGMGSLYRSQHELIFVFKNGKAPHVNNVQLGRHGRHRTNVWNYPGLNGFGRDRDKMLALHPSVKPVGLLADALRDSSKRGDIVLDPFAGSGSIILAAERTRRRAATIEIDPLYVDVAVRRWQAFSGLDAVLEGDGRTFTEIAAERRARDDDKVEAAHG